MRASPGACSPATAPMTRVFRLAQPESKSQMKGSIGLTYQLQRLAEDGETVTPSLPEPGVWTGMASANALAPLRWKRAKIHRGSRRRRRSLTPHKEAGYTSAVVTLGPGFAKSVAIGRGPYTSRHDRY